MRKLSHPELVQRQKGNGDSGKLPFSILLNNVRSLYNVGSIFRTADGAGVEKILLCGITGIPPDSKITKTALGAEKAVPWEFCASAKECIQRLKKKGCQIVLLEQTQESLPYQDFEPKTPLCLVIGNETKGVSEDLLPYCDQAVEIEMSGLKNSLNVTVALGIVAYDFRQKILKRDKNNCHSGRPRT